MKKIQYTKHLLNRLRVRKLSKRLIRFLLKHPTLTLFDNLNNTSIIIGKKNKQLYIVAYIEKDTTCFILTIHPIKKSQIDSRIRNKRWTIKENLS